MSKNIDIKLLEKQIRDIVDNLNENKIIGSEITESEKIILKQTYSYLYESSSTLFEMILTNFKNKEFLEKHIRVILENLYKLQNQKLSSYDASANVGTHFANEYFPKK
jgi:hypothetical protein